jgi:hypothetical protein
MQIKLLLAAFFLTSTSVSAQSWLYPGYKNTVAASGFSYYRSPATGFIARRPDARLDEPCSGQNLYSLRSLSFEMTCGYWDQLNNRPWGIGDVENIHEPFEGSFHSP